MLQCLALLCALVSAGDAFAVQPPFRAASHRPVGSSRPVMLEPLTVGGMAKLGLVIGMALGKRAIKDERPAEGTICQECEACASQKYLERCLARPSATTSRGRRRSPGPTMLDSNLLVGGVMLVGGTALGVGGIAFIENRGEKSKDSMSDETKSRMAGMFMEDEVLATPLDDTITKMEAALAQAEGRDVVDGDGLSEKEKAELTEPGWGD